MSLISIVICRIITNKLIEDCEMGRIIMFGFIGGFFASSVAAMYGQPMLTVIYVYTITSIVVAGITSFFKFIE